MFLGDTDFSKYRILRKVKKLKKKYFIIDFSNKNDFAKEKKILTELVLENLEK